MESQTPQDLKLALEQLEIDIKYQVDFRVYTQSGGQPDFDEAVTYLNKIAGINQWVEKSRNRCVDTHNINGMTYLTMSVTLSVDTLMLLKWFDIEKGELRVLFEKQIR